MRTLSLIACLALLAPATIHATPIKRAPGVFNIRPSGALSFVRPPLPSPRRYPAANELPQCLGTVETPANGVTLYNIPCARPPGSDPAYLAFELEPQVPGVVKLQGTNFCVDAGLGELGFWGWCRGHADAFANRLQRA